jgi:hypothetical protein
MHYATVMFHSVQCVLSEAYVVYKTFTKFDLVPSSCRVTGFRYNDSFNYFCFFMISGDCWEWAYDYLKSRWTRWSSCFINDNADYCILLYGTTDRNDPRLFVFRVSEPYL